MQTTTALDVFDLAFLSMEGIPAATLAAHPGMVLVQGGRAWWVKAEALDEFVGEDELQGEWLDFHGERAEDLCDICEAHGLVTPDAPSRGPAVKEICGTLPRFPRPTRICEACWSVMSAEDQAEILAEAE